MKIIKKGVSRVEETWVRQVECTGNGNACTEGCGAILEVNMDDVRFYTNHCDLFVHRPDAVVMRCPCCGGITDLKKKDWPKDTSKLKKFSMAWRLDGE